MGRRKKQHPKIYRDELGEYRWQTYFVGGKQKRMKIRLIDSMDADEFIENNTIFATSTTY